MIKRLKIYGYKSIREFDQPLTPLTVLVGPNDSGKSSLLEAFNLLGKAVAEPLPAVFRGQTALDVIAWRGNRDRRLRWEVGFEEQPLGEFYYVLDVAERGARGELVEERLHHNGVIVLEHDHRGVRSGDYSLVPPSTGVIESALPPFLGAPGVTDAEIRSYLRATRQYQFDPAEIARPSAFDPQAGAPAMDSRGYGLPSVLAALKLGDLPRFQQIEAALRQAIPSIREVLLRPSTVKVRSVEGQVDWSSLANTAMPERLFPGEHLITMPGHRLAFVLEGNGWEIPAEHASAGVLLFLAYLTLVFSEHPPRHLLIEEPENGIHPRRLKDIVELLRKLTEGVKGGPATQVIITTHSPYLLDFVRPEEVLIFKKGTDGAAQVTRMIDAPDLETRLGEQELGELWFNVGEDVLSSAKKSTP